MSDTGLDVGLSITSWYAWSEAPGGMSVSSVEPLLVDEAERRGHEYFGLPQGATPGDHIDQVEEVEGDDESVHRSRDHGRPQQWKRDAEELLRARGSVDRGRLVVLLADALKRAGGDDRHERPAEPDVRDQKGEVRERERDPGDGRVDLVDPADVEVIRRDADDAADRGESLVDRAVVGVEHVPPDRRDDEGRHDDRKNEDGSVEPAEAKARRVQDDRDEYADRHVEDDVRERPEEIEGEHSPEAEVGDDRDAVRDEIDEVLQPDEVRCRRIEAEIAQPVVGEGHVDLEEDRPIGDR